MLDKIEGCLCGWKAPEHARGDSGGDKVGKIFWTVIRCDIIGSFDVTEMSRSHTGRQTETVQRDWRVTHTANTIVVFYVISVLMGNCDWRFFFVCVNNIRFLFYRYIFDIDIQVPPHLIRTG